jgi:hypothetical protein
VSTASQRIKRTQRGVLLFLVASNALNYVDRSAIAIANPLIRHDLGMSLTQMGLVLSAFLWTYSVMQLPAGVIVDRFKPRLMLTVGLLDGPNARKSLSGRRACKILEGVDVVWGRFWAHGRGSSLVPKPVWRVKLVAELRPGEVTEAEGYLGRNQDTLVHYAARRRRGEPISTAFVESAVNEIIARAHEREAADALEQDNSALLPLPRF